MKIIVRVTNGKQTYEEDVTEEQRKHFDDCQSNGANSWLEKLTFEHYTRPIKESLMEKASLDKYNVMDENAHFVFGWMEAFSQSDDVPVWMLDAKELTIEVKHIEELNHTVHILEDILSKDIYQKPYHRLTDEKQEEIAEIAEKIDEVQMSEDDRIVV